MIQESPVEVPGYGRLQDSIKALIWQHHKVLQSTHLYANALWTAKEPLFFSSSAIFCNAYYLLTIQVCLIVSV